MGVVNNVLKPVMVQRHTQLMFTRLQPNQLYAMEVRHGQ
jgi:hypothetical protein